MRWTVEWTALEALGAATFKKWDERLAKATWLVNTRGSVNPAGPAASEILHTAERGEVPVVHVGESCLGYFCLEQRQTHYCGCICSRTCVHVMGNAAGWEIRCVPQGCLILGENSG